MIVGLTGGIASGKSVVARIFAMLGCAVFHSDAAAKQAYFRADVRDRITKLLGPEVYLTEKSIDKKQIARRIFSDDALLSSLNAIIHPAVKKMFADFVHTNRGSIIIKESALLFEANATDGLDKIIVVSAPDEERIKRVMLRDKQSRNEAVARLNSQMAQTEKTKRADFVIINDEKQLLIRQVEAIFTLLKES